MNNANGAKSLEKLSSGYRINRAGDDAAGLAISEKMRAQIRGLAMASKNSQDAISLVQTAEGALSETQSILQRMRELAVQAANDTNVSIDREQIQKEMNQLTSEVNRIGNATEFNTMTLLNGTLQKTVLTSETNVADDVKTQMYASKVSSGSTADMQAGVGQIDIDNTSHFYASQISGSGSISIVRINSIQLDVNIVEGTAITTASTFSDSITLDANGGFTYDNHGISFTIAASSAATISAGESLTVGSMSAGTTNVGTISTYVYSGVASNATTLTDVTITAHDDIKKARTITINNLNTTSIANTLTVTFKDSAGGTIHSDVIVRTANGAYNYVDHGIDFTITATNNSALATTTATITLTEFTTVGTSFDDKSLQFQVGANQSQNLNLEVGDMRGVALAVSSTTGGGNFTATTVVTNTSSATTEYALDISTGANAANAITTINSAITLVSAERAKLGSVQNRLEHTINNLEASGENLQASESRIRDVDMAKEMMEFTKNNILMQAAQAMLAQANQQPQGVLQLLR
jgi:flagellin